MGRSRLVLAASIALVLDGGCLYASHSLQLSHGTYTNYPASVEGEHARRAHRRKLALLGGPLEMIAGVGLTSLALFAPSTPQPDDDPGESWSGGVESGAKDLAGRLLLATAGSGLAVSGLGDIVLGATDPAFSSPLIRGGALVPADQIDRVAPARGPRFDFHFGEMASLRAIGEDGGMGLARWLTPSLRMREAVTGGYDLVFRHPEDGPRWWLGGEVGVDWAFARRHAGLYPSKSIGLYGAAAWTRVDDLDRAILHAGLSTSMPQGQLRLGATFIPGVDTAPTVELGWRMEWEVD
ncbi:MAG TPA: hypothetical protein VHE35_13465 [Kofleriaceae bacterium]|nr:hypothetical protein [Kofleriaceae bacterium]